MTYSIVARDPHAGVVHNLRVDDHAQPVVELARLLRYNRGFREHEVATEALFGGNAADPQAATRRLIEHRPSWEIVIRGFASKGLLPVPEGVGVDAFVKGP